MPTYKMERETAKELIKLAVIKAFSGDGKQGKKLVDEVKEKGYTEIEIGVMIVELVEESTQKTNNAFGKTPIRRE